MLGVPTSSFPSNLSPQRQGNSSNARNKIALRPGRSLMDWIKLTKGNNDLQGFNGRTRAVTIEELSRHKTVGDCWMAIHGLVYNVSHYMEYHPGGIDELMKGAGKDATDLFEAVHKWVNYSSMLAKCLIGPLKYEIKLTSAKAPPRTKESSFLVPSLPAVLRNDIPRYEWYEKGNSLILSIYVKQAFHYSDVILDCEDGTVLDMKILFSEKYYHFKLEMEHPLSTVRMNTVTSKKLEITLRKTDEALKWSNFGRNLPGHHSMNLNNKRELKFRKCHIKSVEKVTHDTKLYTIELPLNCYYESRIGHHVKIRAEVDGVEVQRSYTTVLPSLDLITPLESTIRGRFLYLMIKHYEKGALTPTLSLLEKGSCISVSDSLGSFNRLMLEDKSNVYFIAAGTGLTPMIRLIAHYLHDTDNSCKLKLLFANKQVRDILWKDQIDRKVDEFPTCFHCRYILNEPCSSWDGLCGRIDEQTLRNFISDDPFLKDKDASGVPSVNTGEFFAVCGPDEFTLSIKEMLSNIGIADSSIHCFLG